MHTINGILYDELVSQESSDRICCLSERFVYNAAKRHEMCLNFIALIGINNFKG